MMGGLRPRKNIEVFRGLHVFKLMQPLHNKRRKTELTLLIVVVIILFIQSFAQSSSAKIKATNMCNRIPHLSPKQRKVCYSNPHTAVIADEGSFMGQEECQRQFKYSRWNCNSENDVTVMGVDENLGTKEAAYHGAIRAAGVLHAAAKACGEGNLRNCGCDAKRRGHFRSKDYRKWGVMKNSSSRWIWGGCSVDINRAYKLSKEIWDSREISRSVRAMMNLHNYEAGRKSLLRHMKIQCKCHGVSASCVVRTCWITLPDFRAVGNTLHNAYSRSKKVENIFPYLNRHQYPKLVYVKNGIPKKPQKRELIYTHDSPSYCVYNHTTRTIGTEGRICRYAGSVNDNCSYLCCGRGHKLEQNIRTWDCKCKFYWCCRLECEECQEPAKQSVCL